MLTKNGLEDAPVTLPNHPLKKFAEAPSAFAPILSDSAATPEEF